jgi:hypothetical protein
MGMFVREDKCSEKRNMEIWIVYDTYFSTSRAL